MPGTVTCRKSLMPRIMVCRNHGLGFLSSASRKASPSKTSGAHSWRPVGAAVRVIRSVSRDCGRGTGRTRHRARTGGGSQRPVRAPAACDPPGDNYLFYTAKRGHPEPLFKWRGKYWSFLLKLSPDKPSPTIQAQPGPYIGPFHSDNRRLRVAEIKKLFTYPTSSNSSVVVPRHKRSSVTRSHPCSPRKSLCAAWGGLDPDAREQFRALSDAEAFEAAEVLPAS